MSHLRPYRLILGLIALLAIGWAQTFGLHRGFMCDCGGAEHIIQVDHCHGPHSTACHEDEEHSMPHQHDEDAGDKHEHAAVVDSLIAKQQNDFAFSIAAPVKTLDELQMWESIVLVPSEDARWTLMPPPRAGPAQEWPRLLTRVIALRI